MPVHSDQEISPEAQDAKGPTARKAPSIAMDMPLPVSGGIMVRESPTRTPG